MRVFRVVEARSKRQQDTTTMMLCAWYLFVEKCILNALLSIFCFYDECNAMQCNAMQCFHTRHSWSIHWHEKWLSFNFWSENIKNNNINSMSNNIHGKYFICPTKMVQQKIRANFKSNFTIIVPFCRQWFCIGEEYSLQSEY